MPYQHPYFYSTENDTKEKVNALIEMYGQWSIQQADVIVVLGGDGLLLTAVRKYKKSGLPIYGMNCGSVGFLMNAFSTDKLLQRLNTAEITPVHPLEMRIIKGKNKDTPIMAFNEVSLLRQSHQAARISIAIDGKLRMSELIADGLIISTAIGSTAYNLSANGPIIPVGNHLLAVTPISPFRPRRWRGALLPSEAVIKIYNTSPSKRPISATADNIEVRDVEEIDIYENKKCTVSLLFDRGHNLDERILEEQFWAEPSKLY